MTPLCRCGREDWQHKPLPINSYSPPCRTYTPMDFDPFDDQIRDCCCALHNQLAYAVSVPPVRRRDWVPASNAIYDALLTGSHEYVSWRDWVEQLKARTEPEKRHT